MAKEFKEKFFKQGYLRLGLVLNLMRYLKDKEVVNYLDVLVDGQYVDRLHDFTLKWRRFFKSKVIDDKRKFETK